MAAKHSCSFLLAALCPVFALAAAPPSSPAKGKIRVSVKNEYLATLNFGPLGNGTRDGIDTAEGVLEFQAGKYVGTVTAFVGSTQTLTGMAGSCGPDTYRNEQQLQVTGHPVDGFNTEVQTITFNQSASTGSASNEYLLLEFAPVPGNELQPPNPDPNQDQVINCHTIIETPAGRFLPLNDSRWTLEGGGYIIVLPSTGVLNYTDKTVPGGSAGNALAPIFDAKKSVWTVTVERLP